MSLSTTVTRLTPRGRGAIATVVVRGTAAANMVERCFQPAGDTPFSQSPCRRIVFGFWKSSDWATEELIVSRVEDSLVEVHCHGGEAAVRAIIQSLVQQGAQEIEPYEFLLQTEKCRWETEAAMALETATTLRTAEHLLSQYHGALARKVSDIQRAIALREYGHAWKQLSALLEWSSFGLHLTTPYRVVLAGYPNVGKSSLMNALVGYNRSIVFETPGTTRDLVTAQTACEGWPVTLIDAAGLRASHDPIEVAGVQLAIAAIEQADLVLLVADAAQPWPVEYDRWLSEWQNSMAVLNKCDLSDQSAIIFPKSLLCVSARTGAGLAELLHAIAQRLVPRVPEVVQGIPFHPRHVQLLASAQRFAQQGDFARASQELRLLED